MRRKRAYRYRFYPTEEQKQILAKTFGCVRYVYNWGLRLRTDAYYNDSKRLYYKDLSAQLTALKRQKETVWLNEISSVPLQQELRHLDRAFINFFEGRGEYPTFHKKRGKQSATYAASAFKWNGERLTLAKMSEPLNIRWSRDFVGTPSTVTVSKDSTGRYFVSILVEEEIEQKEPVNTQVGIDLGLTDAVIVSTGQKFGNPRFFRKDEKRLAKAQRQLARKQKGSNNRAKARLKAARIHAKIADRRLDFLHKLSTRLINENQVIAVERLQVKNMIRNHHLAKSIADVGWGELIRQLEYKADWYGRTLVKIDKFYPSSKRCFDCGHIMPNMPLHIRNWTCPECGEHHDRDVNAAQNILAAGQAVLACGEAVRPARKLKSQREGKPQRSRKAN
ncbi:IS200/IS605 family element RNA-guided endonuclease TnpB [Alicyclobacillus suci]|uniref:IS200/IS605 family element RNA-guided endonuclease TnpB n=2 Tax=Alicyclobacillus suci TaxID=2816080 RepID=UPI001A8C352B|nr:IS200/IS605 family element RNA-guided endonuclease TnpB [Alicyclobacillus suci]